MSAAYVATARIERGRPRLNVAPVAVIQMMEEWQPNPGAARDDLRVVDAGPSAEPRVIELRWAAFRERWSQLWFFVRDPESWR
jgi:hypothetical protein